MSIYSERGVATNFSGDIQLGANGDLKLADSYETQKAAINWFMRTNKGDYVPDQRLGCDAGRFIGDKMSRRAADQLESSALGNLTKFLVSRSDIDVNAIPIDSDTLGIFVTVGGKYLDSDGNLLDPGTEIITYTFPYLEGEPTPEPFRDE